MSADLKRQVMVALALRDKNQAWLAKELSMNQGYLSRILNGRDESPKQVSRIKGLLGISDERSEDSV